MISLCSKTIEEIRKRKMDHFIRKKNKIVYVKNVINGYEQKEN